MAVKFHDYHTPANTITLYANTITLSKKSNNKITPVKSSYPVIVRLGKTATIKMTGRIYSTTDFNLLNAFGGETVLVVDDATPLTNYIQLPTASNWLVLSIETKQGAGNTGHWDYTLELASYYGGGVY